MERTYPDGLAGEVFALRERLESIEPGDLLAVAAAALLEAAGMLVSAMPHRSREFVAAADAEISVAREAIARAA